MTLENLMTLLQTNPDSIEFQDVMTVIADGYVYTPTCFTNGFGDDLVVNAAGENEGSCKIFALGQLLGLSERQTLACFGKFYREDVLQHPEGADHSNIRTFIRHGWAGIHFDNQALVPKTTATD
jgi:hypothetical protein